MFDLKASLATKCVALFSFCQRARMKLMIKALQVLECPKHSHQPQNAYYVNNLTKVLVLNDDCFVPWMNPLF